MSLGRLYKVQGGVGAGQGEAGTSALLFSGARIPRETLQAMSLADHVLTEAQTAAAQLRAQSISSAEAHKQQAYAQGFNQGRAQAMIAVLGTLEIERRLRELLSHRMADIVEHCVRSLLGDLGEPALMRQRILHLLASCGSGLGSANALPSSSAPSAPSASSPNSSQDPSLGGATLYVCPAQFPLAQQLLAELSQGTSGHVAGLTLVADPRRPMDALLLETKFSFVDSNLTLTLQETRTLVQHALSHALQVLSSAA